MDPGVGYQPFAGVTDLCRFRHSGESRNPSFQTTAQKTVHGNISIAALEEAAANKIHQHEEDLKAIKAELRRREESRKFLVEQYSRAFEDYRRLKEEDETRKKEARTREAAERSRRLNEEAKQQAQARLAAQEIGVLKQEAAVSPEPEKKPGFTLGR
jgi:hypothetical protein